MQSDPALLLRRGPFTFLGKFVDGPRHLDNLCRAGFYSAGAPVPRGQLVDGGGEALERWHDGTAEPQAPQDEDAELYYRERREAEEAVTLDLLG